MAYSVLEAIFGEARGRGLFELLPIAWASKPDGFEDAVRSGYDDAQQFLRTGALQTGLVALLWRRYRMLCVSHALDVVEKAVKDDAQGRVATKSNCTR